MLGLRLLSGSRLDAARRTRAILLEEAKREAEATRREAQIEARDQSVKLRAEIEDEVRERRVQIAKIEEITTVAIRKRLHKAFALLESSLDEESR